MNDEFDGGDKLVALMRSAASVHDAPPPAFDHADVLAGSHRITRRHRMIAAGATGLVLIASLGTAALLPMLQSNNSNSGSSVAEAPRTTMTAPAQVPAPGAATPFSAVPTQPAPAGPRAPDRVLPVPGGSAPAPNPQPAQPGGAQPPPPASGGGQTDDPGAGGGGKPKPGGDNGNGGNGHTGNGTDPRNEPGEPAEGGNGGTGPQKGCQSGQAPDLSGAVSAVVEGASGGSQSCRSNGDSELQVEVTKDGRKGSMTVVFSPKGGGSPGGTTATTASGGKVGVSVRATGDGPAPYADELGRIAGELASRL